MKKVVPELKIETLFPQLLARAENAEDEKYLVMVQHAVDLMNLANIEKLSALLKVAQDSRAQLDDNNAIAAIKGAVADAGIFNKEYNNVLAREKLSQLLQDPDRVANLIRIISKADNALSAEDKNRLAGELFELSERYQAFGAMACLDQVALAKTSRMLETMIEYSKFHIQNNDSLSQSFKESLTAYITQIEIYREFMSNRMAYFIEMHQTELRRIEVNVGFGDACRHWQLLEEEKRQSLPELFDGVMQPFYKNPMHVGNCETFSQSLQQERLPNDPFGGDVATDNINDYFLLFIEKHGSRDAKLRVLGCGACFSEKYQANSWAAWMHWGMVYFIQVCGTVKRTAITAPEIALAPIAMITEKLKPVRSAEEIAEDARYDSNRRKVQRLKNLLRSAHRYMRPNPEECIYDVKEHFSHARALVRKIDEAPHFYKSYEYANLSMFATLRLFNLIFEKMIDYMGTPRQQVFMQIFSDTVSACDEHALLMTEEFDGDPVLQHYYDRMGLIEDADDAIMTAILLCVKFKDYYSHDPKIHSMLCGAFYALSLQLGELMKANHDHKKIIDALAELMMEFGRNFRGTIREEIDAFLRDRLGYHVADINVKLQQDFCRVFKDYNDSYQRYSQLCALRTEFLADVPRQINKNPMVLRPPYSLFAVFENELRDDILMVVVKKKLGDKKYLTPIAIANCLPHIDQCTQDNFVMLIKLACLDYANHTQDRTLKHTSSSRSEQLLKLIVRVSNLEIHHFRLPSQDQELVLVNKIEKLQALYDMLFAFKKALDWNSILPSRLSEKLTRPMELIHAEIANLKSNQLILL